MRLHAVCLVLATGLLVASGGTVFAQQTKGSAPEDAQGGAKPQAAGTPGQFNLAAFTNITSCLPFNILITPSATGSSSTGYTLTTSVAPEVDAALNVAVANSTLYLGFNRRFDSTVPIRVTVSMPADKLEVVENKGMGNVIINPGFKVTANTVTLITSAGSILSRNLSTPQLFVEASGTSVVFARGDIEVANVTAQGTASVTLSGVSKAVGAELEGISRLYVDAASDAVTISPSAEGLSKVYYNKGQCDSKSKTLFMDMPSFFSMDMDLGFSSCVQMDDPEDYPAYRALWSCGIRVRGASICVPGDAAAQEAAQDAATISVASANSGGGSSRASASATGTTPATASSPSTPTPPAQPATPSTSPPTPTPTVISTAPMDTPTKPSTQSAFQPIRQPTRLQNEAGAAADDDVRSPIVASASDIRVAAAGRRRLQGADFHRGFGGLGEVMASSSSSSSSSSRGGRRSETVAVASLECEAADSELYIGA